MYRKKTTYILKINISQACTQERLLFPRPTFFPEFFSDPHVTAIHLLLSVFSVLLVTYTRSCTWTTIPKMTRVSRSYFVPSSMVDEETCKKWCLETSYCVSIDVTVTNDNRCYLFRTYLTESEGSPWDYSNIYELECSEGRTVSVI